MAAMYHKRYVAAFCMSLTKPICILPFYNDTHCGGITALAPPSFKTREGVTITHTRVQSHIWDCFQDYCGHVREYKRGGAFVYSVFDGDLSEGNHHETPQILIANEDEHADLAVETLQLPVSLSDKVAFVGGTEAHVGPQSNLEQMIARAFRSYDIDRPDDTSSLIHRILRRTINDTSVNVAHHIGGGNKETTKQAAINGAVVDHITRCGKYSEPPADYLMRAHKHKFADTGTAHRFRRKDGCWRVCRGITLASWQYPTSYIYKIDPDGADFPDIGGVIIRLYADGRSDIEPLIYPFIQEQVIYKAVSISNGEKNDSPRTKSENQHRGRTHRRASGSHQRSAVRGRSIPNNQRNRRTVGAERGRTSQASKNTKGKRTT